MLGLLVLAGMACMALWSQPAQAQPAPAPAAAPAAAPGAAPGAAPSDAPPQKGRVQWFLESSGWIGAGILLLSIYFIATVVRLLVELRPEIAIPPHILEQCTVLRANQDLRGINSLIASDTSLYSELVSTGLSELPEGVTKAREAMERLDDFRTAQLEKQIAILAVLGTLGPMIGLLGTLKGMIASFSVIAMSGTELRPNEVAEGISQALLLTFEGVSLSVPAIYFYAFFRSRVMLITAEALLKADELVRWVAKVAKTRTAPPPPPGAAPASAMKGGL